MIKTVYGPPISRCTMRITGRNSISVGSVAFQGLGIATPDGGVSAGACFEVRSSCRLFVVGWTRYFVRYFGVAHLEPLVLFLAIKRAIKSLPV